jgi:predicted Zn-dependent peptidase
LKRKPGLRLRLLTCSILVLFFIVCTVPLQAASDRGFTKVTLENGLKVMYKVMKGQPRTSVNAVFPIGMNGEKEKGIAHLLEHLVFRGGAGYNFNDIAGITVRGGGYFGGFTYITATSYSYVIPNDKLMTALKIFNGSVWNTDTSETSIALEKKIVLHELDMGYSERYEYYPLFHYLLPEFSYNADTIARITQADLQEFHRTYYQAANATYIIAGDFDPKPLLAELATIGNSYGQGGIVKPEVRQFDLPTEDIEESRNLYPYQYQLMLAYQFDKMPEKDRAVLKLLSQIYGVDYKINYERNEYNFYNVFYRHLGDTDYFSIYYREQNQPFDPEQLKQKKATMLKYFREFKKINLKQAQENLEQVVELEEAQSEGSSVDAAQYEINRLIDPDFITPDTFSLMKKITVKDLERVIDQYFKEPPRTWILVKNTKSGGK